jgi:DNA-directed RNA polymerase specialized sigma24 family protein
MLFEGDDLLKQLEQGMMRPSERDRRILLLRDRQHAAYDEIARTKVISLGTVRSRIFRVRAHLCALERERIAAETSISEATL